MKECAQAGAAEEPETDATAINTTVACEGDRQSEFEYGRFWKQPIILQ